MDRSCVAQTFKQRWDECFSTPYVSNICLEKPADRDRGVSAEIPFPSFYTQWLSPKRLVMLHASRITTMKARQHGTCNRTLVVRGNLPPVRRALQEHTHGSNFRSGTNLSVFIHDLGRSFPHTGRKVDQIANEHSRPRESLTWPSSKIIAQVRHYPWIAWKSFQ